MHNVLVTGGSRGIGLAISRKLAAAGYYVIAVARRESDELKAAIGEIVKQGRGGLRFRAFDLSEIDAIPAFEKIRRACRSAWFSLVFICCLQSVPAGNDSSPAYLSSRILHSTTGPTPILLEAHRHIRVGV